MQEEFLNSLGRLLPRDSWTINGKSISNGGKTISICFPEVDAETLILMLSNDGICVSAGSACTSHESTPSHVLKAMGLSDEDARSSIRVSFSELNVMGDAEYAGTKIAENVTKLRLF